MCISGLVVRAQPHSHPLKRFMDAEDKAATVAVLAATLAAATATHISRYSMTNLNLEIPEQVGMVLSEDKAARDASLSTTQER